MGSLVSSSVLLLLVALLGSTQEAAADTTGCFSLAKSKYCGAGFGNYQLSQFIYVGGVTVSNVVQFDRVLDSYLGSAADHADTNRELGCSGWDGGQAPRYRISYLCRSYLANTSSQQCNLGISPPSLCRASCLEYTEGWGPIVSNSTACPNQGLAKTIWKDLVASCDSPYYSGTETEQCVDGAVNEADTCGFGPKDDVSICSYCSGPSSTRDACCRTAIPAYQCTTHDPTDKANNNGSGNDDPDSQDGGDSAGLSPGRIAAIVVPSVVGSLLLLALLAFILHRRKRIEAEKNELFPHVSASSQRLLNMAPGALAAAAVAANGSNQSFEPVQCRVVYPFTPRMDDEVQLTPGDILLLLKIFDDGWAVANNLTTGREGAMPLVCVTPYHPDSAQGSKSEEGEGGDGTTTSRAGGEGTDSSGGNATRGVLNDTFSSSGGSSVAAAAGVGAVAAAGVGTISNPHLRSTDLSSSEHGAYHTDTFSADEIERSLSSLNASAAAIAAAVSAATGSHSSIPNRVSGSVHDSQIPRRSSSKRPKKRGMISSLNDSQESA
ncbi:hypothetical protein H4R33_005467 [Dimargaris cristalligena]|uniref:SH3 domain-containing protein n=1 Tax=Dimargaris cristalligena TaxID=215637 RepID=A0A4P9ZSS7_9FUNG|nr:hypothetical protein H4R33_005467 [Dimargaris cristalligena]RKP36248.1 hypothetical protein BJ085DRAFT_41119 [Dimargaris cristalligena]|eukprot:RKP36248.1 hypothetical protein BJ085DRAFT_41119 [Dimargaris cristalligena]